VSVTFDLRGEGGGSWTVSSRDGSAEVARRAEQNGKAGPASPEPYADCVLRCEVSDFRALISGALDPRRGFLERRLDIEGDVGLVLRLLRSVG
jgi:predicted lipid carrier protein YhbT